MIKADQPSCFPGDVVVVVSSKEDGTMLNREAGIHHPDVLKDREGFCRQANSSYKDVVYQKIIYSDEQTYDELVEVGKHNVTRFVPEVHADALFTVEHGVGLFLPVADCVATVVYDPVEHALALLHLGRHSTLTLLVKKTIDRFVVHGCDPTNLIVWMGPSAGREAYRLDWFDQENDSSWKGFYAKNSEGYFLDLAGYNQQRFVESGVRASNITISGVDTTANPNYFSHMMGDVTGRIAVLAMML